VTSNACAAYGSEIVAKVMTRSEQLPLG
jgi:hypothetical protein